MSLPPSFSSTFSSDNNLHFVEAPALAPPEVAYDQNDMIRYEQELTEAAAMPLPDVRRYIYTCLSLHLLVSLFVLLLRARSLSLFFFYLFVFVLLRGLFAIVDAHSLLFSFSHTQEDDDL